MPQNTSAGFHEYTISWKKERIRWLVDGFVIRELERTAGEEYPETPARAQFSVWDGSSVSTWAGGPIEWGSGSQGLQATLQSMTIQCDDGLSKPTGPPTRPENYPVPKMNERAIKNALPGTENSDYFPVGTVRFERGLQNSRAFSVRIPFFLTLLVVTAYY